MRNLTSSLRFRLTVPSLLVVFVLWVGYTAFWTNKYESDARSGFEENGRLAAHLFSGAVSDALWEFDVRSAQQTLSGLSVWPGFMAAVVMDTGHEFASYDVSTASTQIELPQSRAFDEQGVFRGDDRVYFRSAIIHSERGELGHLIAVFDRRPLLQTIWTVRRNAVISALIGFALLGHFLWWTARSVTRPLLRITRAVEQVAEGDLNIQVPEGKKLDEVARLGRALDVFRKNAIGLVAAKADAEASKRVAELAMVDELTGLANRRAVVARFAEIERSGDLAGQMSWSVVQIDLDGFKRINDTLGHGAGDHVLKEVAKRLSTFHDHCDLVARIGGDEFVLLIRHGATDTLPQDIAAAVVENLALPVSYRNQNLRIGASAGIANHRHSPHSLSDALVHADIALYRAKSHGKGRFVTFDKAHSLELLERSRKADEIIQGIENSHFVPFFQPIVDAETHRIVALEMLARWEHPTEGLLTPDRFLDLANDLNVMKLIDAQVFTGALDLFAGLKAEGLVLPRLSINVSNKRLLEQNFIETLATAKATGIEIDVELLETIYLDDPPEELLLQLDRVRELGIGLSIDDFGTGHASVAGLIQIDPDKVKIDRRFIDPMLDSKRSLNIVQTLLGLCALLEIEVVAEGVESMAQAELLRSLGCQYLQGYAFMRPVSAQDIRTSLTERRSRLIG